MTSQSKAGFIEVSPGVWAAIMSIIPPEGGGPNAGFILAGRQVVVVDSLISPSMAQQMAKQLRQVTDRAATYLINTHGHGDHVFGNQVFSPPATIIAHKNVRDVLLSQGKAMVKSTAERWGGVLPDIKDTTVLPPHITYTERMTLHLDERTVELIHAGTAHTTGDTMVYLPAEKVLFSGDILFNHIIPPIMGSSAGWIAAIEKLEAMDIETIVPGHGFIAAKKDLGDLKRLLIELRRQVKDCFTRGLLQEQTVKELDMPYLKWPHPERIPMGVALIYEELKKEGRR
ncbi:MAG: MBL fold metallo-hydrolase [Chloroflexota bacterium]